MEVMPMARILVVSLVLAAVVVSCGDEPTEPAKETTVFSLEMEGRQPIEVAIPLDVEPIQSRLQSLGLPLLTLFPRSSDSEQSSPGFFAVHMAPNGGFQGNFGGPAGFSDMTQNATSFSASTVTTTSFSAGTCDFSAALCSFAITACVEFGELFMELADTMVEGMGSTIR